MPDESGIASNATRFNPGSWLRQAEHPWQKNRDSGQTLSRLDNDSHTDDGYAADVLQPSLQ